jgi:hypothetical protein
MFWVAAFMYQQRQPVGAVPEMKKKAYAGTNPVLNGFPCWTKGQDSGMPMPCYDFNQIPSLAKSEHFNKNLLDFCIN